MGIFERAWDVFRSYLSEDSDTPRRQFRDPDVEAANQELNDFLSGKSKQERFDEPSDKDWFDRNTRQSGAGSGPAGRNPQSPGQEPPIPESIQRDFAELGLPPGAAAEECKRAYKNLLKKHHPDRHAGHPGNMRKATEKSARLNTAFERIERWRQTGKAD